jgi:hypothetical protein
MGPFDHIQKKGSIAIRPQPAQIRKEIISTVSSVRKTTDIASRKVFNGGKAPTSQPASSRLKARGRETRKRSLQPQERLTSDSEDEDHSKVDSAPKKRQKTDVDVEPDISREMCNKKSFLGNGDGIPGMVHAAEIATVGKCTKYKLAFPEALKSNQVEVQYPSAGTLEK